MVKNIFIEGMSCAHCVRHVEEALEHIQGIKSVSVNLKEKSAKIELIGEVNDDVIKAAIEDVGYDVTEIN
jgi:Cu2+-exporting ATPase/Cu+-exporting ATPase